MIHNTNMRKSFTGAFKVKAVLEILKEEKTISQIASELEIHPNRLSRWKKEAIEGLSEILEDGRRKGDQEKEALKNQIQELYAEIGELTTKLNWLKKNLELSLNRQQRVNMIDFQNMELPLIAQADLLSLNRTSLYYRPVQASSTETSIKHAIDRIYTEDPYMGSRPITAILNREGISISRPTVMKYMREMGIHAIYPGPNLSKRNQEHKIYPYLLRGVIASHPNHIWGTDITYIRLRKGWMYLVAFMDWLSRYVLAWELDYSLEVDFVIEALNLALSIAKPEIANSDQGSQFTSNRYTELLLGNNIRISMDGRGRAFDNIFTERLWRTVKYQEVYINDYESPREASQGITKFINKYNNYRPHQSLKNLTPAQVYFGKYRLEDFQ